MLPGIIHEQKVGDRQIDTGNFNRLVAAGNRALAVEFDPQDFDMVDTGLYLLVMLAPRVYFSGNGYAADGVLTTGLNSDMGKPWVKYVVDTGVFSEEAGPAPSPWPANEIWYEKANTYGNIVVTRIG